LFLFWLLVWQVCRLAAALSDVLEATARFAEKKQTRTVEEREAELREEEEGVLPEVRPRTALDQKEEGRRSQAVRCGSLALPIIAELGHGSHLVVSLVLCRWLGRVRGRRGRGMMRTTRRSPCTTPRTYHSGTKTHR
jgi:hypothetical protein